MAGDNAAVAFLSLACIASVAASGLSPMPLSGFVRPVSVCSQPPFWSRGHANPGLQASTVVCSTVQETDSQIALVSKPVAPKAAVLRAQKPATKPTLRRAFVDTLFQTMDIDGDGTISRAEFLDALHAIDRSLIEDAAELLFSDDTYPLSSNSFYEWACEGSEIADKLLNDVVRDQASALFNEIDTDASGDIDADELRVLANAMGIKWSVKQTEDVIATIDQDGSGTVNFDEFFGWYFEQSTTATMSLASAAAAQLRLTLRKSDTADQRRVLVKGVPHKATEDSVQAFFADCGEISEIRPLPWARDGTPSGRYVITFAEPGGVAGALKMHRKRMGRRFVEVYRVNQGDKEERLPLSRELHSAVIGFGGSHLQRVEAESGARVFVQSNETDGWVIVKGTDEERAAAKQEIERATSGDVVAADVIAIEAASKGLVIGKGGRTIKRLEVESGAKVEVRDGSGGGAEVVVTGAPGARGRAAGLVAEVLEVLDTSGESVHALPSKFHGTLKGKRGALVEAVQAATDSFVRFDAGGGGQVHIRAPRRIRERTWALIQELRTQVPPVLTLLRGPELAVGDLLSRPAFAGKVADDEMWGVAAQEAIERAKQALASREDEKKSPQQE